LGLFQVDDAEIATGAMRALMCFCAFDQHHWPRGIMPRMEFWSRMRDFIGPRINSSPHLEAIALFLRRFAALAPVEKMHIMTHDKIIDVEPTFEPFLAEVLQFSKQNRPFALPNLVAFWGGFGGASYQFPEAHRPVLIDVFQSFVGSFWDFLDEIHGDLEEDIDSFDHVFTQIWRGALRVLEDVTDPFCGLFAPPSDDASCWRLLILILIATSLVQIREQQEDVLKAQGRVIHAVLGATEPAAPTAAGCGGMLERAILKFAIAVIPKVIGSTTTPITKLLAFGQLDRQGMFDFFAQRFLDGLLVFAGDVPLLHGLLLFINDMSGENRLRPFAEQNGPLSALARREVVLSFDHLDFPLLKKVLPFLNSIYARNVRGTWPQFLSYFDDAFEGMGDARSVFLLFRALKGVFDTKLTVDIAVMLGRWFLDGHVGQTLDAIRGHCGEPEIIGAIAQFWAVFAHRQRADFGIKSAQGIELFNAWLAVVQLIAETWEFEDHEWLIVKIMQPSWAGRYANFGIMQLFGDDSFAVMHKLFFDILERWGSGETGKHMMALLDCVSSIHGILPPVILANERNFAVTCEILAECLLLKDERIWISACNCVEGLMRSSVNAKQSVRPFLQHFIIIFDGFINLGTEERSLREPAVRVIFAMQKCEPEAVHRIYGEILDFFEARYQPHVRELFDGLIVGANGLEECGGAFQSIGEGFRVEFRKFPTQLADIQPFTPYFTRRAPS
jgi:hypothetical protein